jgi:hypothetical protein
MVKASLRSWVADVEQREPPLGSEGLRSTAVLELVAVTRQSASLPVGVADRAQFSRRR